jgi:hypothetical protein
MVSRDRSRTNPEVVLDQLVSRLCRRGGRPSVLILRPPVRGRPGRAGRAAGAAGPQGRTQRPGGRLFRPLRQLVESVNHTLKGQLDLEHLGGRTPVEVAVRVLQRILALTAAIWHNHHTRQPTLRSLVADDH